jgi:hypothetical protein
LYAPDRAAAALDDAGAKLALHIASISASVAARFWHASPVT